MASFLLAWLVIAFQSWAAMLWASFVVFLAVGIIGTMSGVLVMNSDRANYYPWAMPGLIANNFLEIGLPISQLILNLVRGIILFILVNWIYPSGM